MIRFTTFCAGGEEYKLRLTASSIMQIEKKLGKSIFEALEQIKTNMVETVVTILWGALQPMNANMSLEKSYEIFDRYIDEGNSMEDFMQVISRLFEASGFFKKGQA